MAISEQEFENLIEFARNIERQSEYAHKAYLRGEADESLTHIRRVKTQVEYLQKALRPLEDKLEREQ